MKAFAVKSPAGLVAFGILLGALASGLSAPGAETAPTQPSAAVFLEKLPGFSEELARELAGQARRAGYQIELIGVLTLTNPAALTAKDYDLLVLPDARSLPATSVVAVEAYLRKGGDLLAAGLPAWESAVFELNGQWLSKQGYEEELASQQPQNIIEDFQHAALSDWTRSTNEREPQAKYELVDAQGRRALHASMKRMTGWETLLSPRLSSSPFPPGQTLTCFRAKGGPHTLQLALEWMEEDGSRWIATVDLTGGWRNYVLPPEAFKAWQPPPSRSGKADHFNPQKAARYSVGLALTHTSLEDGPQEYWFALLGTAKNPFGEQPPPTGPGIPRLESLSPGYQCFPITTPVVVRPDYQKVPLEDWERKRDAGFPLAPALSDTASGREPLLGLHPRPRGIGFNQERPFRWEPLLGVWDERTKEYRGAIAVLVAHLKGPSHGGVSVLFTPGNVEFYRQPLVTNALHQALTRMKRGLFLSEGGAEVFTAFPGQKLKLGARAVNFGPATTGDVILSIELQDVSGRLRPFKQGGPLTIATNEPVRIETDVVVGDDWNRSVMAVLQYKGEVIDALSHEVHVWKPSRQPKFIEARDGGLWLDGRPWKAHGVNYMPSTGIGIADAHFFEHWLGRGSYDPDVIERDLSRIQAMNLNAVSVFIYHESLRAQNLLDFLRRCEAHGLHVNQSLRPGTPLDFRWSEMKELIEFYRLAQNDTVFAYDLAWEPSHGDSAHQQRAYGRAWNDWVLRRYGDVSSAEKAWAVAAPKPETAGANLSVAVPPMKQLTADGPWRKLVADYRLFLDHLLGKKYGAARQLVKSIDPHHAVSFRMSNAGDPSYNWDAALPYDFYGLAEAVDIWEPEAYGRIGDWDRVKGGEFTAAYARLCAPEKPLLWAEVGCSVWDLNRMAPAAERLAFQGRYFQDFYRMLTESGADGVFFWWYPGGFRLGENSDFGIINPDGTGRPATQVIRKAGAEFLQAAKPARPDYWLSVERARDARGLYGIYDAKKEEFWKAVAEGRRPGLKWEHKPE